MTRALIEKWNVERELAEKHRQLLGSHRRLEAVLDATGDAIAMYDRGERVVFANRWYQDLVGATEGELRRMSPEEITAHFDAHLREPQLTDAEREVLTADGDRVFETVLPDAASERRLFRRTHTAVRDEGTMIGDLYVYRDVSKAIETERMKAEVVRLRSELETTYSVAGMVGSSAPMKRVYALMERAADSDITVLVRGESGTGKELVAKSLHFNGARKDGPFEVVNCAAVPESLIESELFGHEPGAFTGATQRRIGTFERAAGGTVLLDEIGDMQASLQAKLLRVLQEREIQRVGGAATIPVDVRVVAATNRDLEAAIRDGTFREDLYYRLAAFPIVVPPLRERREDIPLLARHVLRRYADRADTGGPGHLDGRVAAVAGICVAGQRPRAGERDRAGGAPGDDRHAAGGKPAPERVARRVRRRRVAERGSAGATGAPGVETRAGDRRQRGRGGAGARHRPGDDVPEAAAVPPGERGGRTAGGGRNRLIPVRSGIGRASLERRRMRPRQRVPAIARNFFPVKQIISA